MKIQIECTVEEWQRFCNALPKENTTVLNIVNHDTIKPPMPSFNVDEHIDEQELKLLKMDRLIDAIKAYRARTGCSLREAKDYMQAIRDNIKR